MSVKIGILASGEGSNFQAIVDQTRGSPAQFAVVIYNNPAAPVRLRAENLGIPSFFLDHRQFPTREALDQAILEVLVKYEVDLVVMAGWMRLVTSVLVDAYRSRMVNIHPSLLPSFRGIRAVEQALEYGVQVTGCSVHFVDLEVDSGPIIAQETVPILADDTVETLSQRIHEAEHRIYPQVVRWLVEGRVQIEGRRVRILELMEYSERNQ
ncbi:MAG: phosphoribosylglycinamide formyltransferase [Gloeobacterales cyanobacterium]